MENRQKWIICGRVIGTATGWNQSDTSFAMSLFDFKPAKGVALPAGDHFISFEDGTVEYWDEGGETVTQSFDLIDALQNAERRKPKAQ